MFNFFHKPKKHYVLGHEKQFLKKVYYFRGNFNRMQKYRLILVLFALLGVAVQTAPAQEQKKYVPSEENVKNREWFRDAGFGMFIHWGIYSMLADGEWVLTNKKINEAEYQKLAEGFCPSKFDAREWVKIAKEAGMKYITFTSRHHDGFSMFDTQQSDYNIVKGTPFGRDIVKELADACREEGLKLFLYYSHIDWHRPDYYPWGRTGRFTGREPSGSWDDYLAFMDAQLTELLTHYGPLGGLWFDGWWDKPDADWQLERQYALIHSIQPGCLIGNNHHKAPFAGEDFQMFERDIPGQNTAGYSADAEIGALPLETCQTMNKTWGYNITDQDFKSTKELLHLLIKTSGNNANLLLNVGPRPNGEIPGESVKHLREMGEWLSRYGETIYATRNGIIPPQTWGVSTQKGKLLYVHILAWDQAEITLPVAPGKIKKVVRFDDKKALKYSKGKEDIRVDLERIPEEIDYILEITLK